METLHIIKIGGNSIDHAESLQAFLSDFSLLQGRKLLVHGGGKLATELATTLQIPQRLVDGRRITDVRTLDVALMVYCGLINKKIVSALQALGCDALGCCGADGDLVRSRKREQSQVDFGYVGDVPDEGVNVGRMTTLLSAGFVPVFSAITHDGNGMLLNTNADTMAAKLAKALSGSYEVSLRYCFEKSGVLLDPSDDASCLPLLNPETYQSLKDKGIISKGMIPKLENAFDAIQGGVKTVTISHTSAISSYSPSSTGTQIVNQ